MENGNYTIALLIDTDNVSPKYMSALDKELIVLGKVTYKRMYGDFAQNASEGWRAIVNEFSITPVQQYTYTTGKNATDSKMIIDAMDILYSGNVNAVCIMSSDSDFTGLAKRLKESNIYVIGAGEKKTPASFVKACDRFFVLEQLVEKDNATELQLSVSTDDDIEKTKNGDGIKNLKKKDIEAFVEKILDEANKPCVLAQVVQKIYQAYPQFDYKAFGVTKASKFFSKEKFTIAINKSTGTMIAL
ncbi:MAG: NYN domain-containing protein, partial [Clostridia bacterium]